MPFHSYRQDSKIDWGKNSNDKPNLEEIRLGAILRIADATEIMAKRHVDLLNDNEYLRKRIKDLTSYSNKLYRQNVSLRGVVTRMRNKLKRNDREST